MDAVLLYHVQSSIDGTNTSSLDVSAVSVIIQINFIVRFAKMNYIRRLGYIIVESVISLFILNAFLDLARIVA